MDDRLRCAWARADPLYIRYHDEEWGVPVHDDRRLFEMLILEGAQAGLSWITILRKREHYREVFDDFEVNKVARYGDSKIEALLADPGIVRNRLKVHATVKNAKAVLELSEEQTLDAFLWQFIGGKPIRHAFRTMSQVPATTPESDAMSKALKKRGFTFVGSTICYAFMQAVGMVDDHVSTCFKRAQADRGRHLSRSWRDEATCCLGVGRGLGHCRAKRVARPRRGDPSSPACRARSRQGGRQPRHHARRTGIVPGPAT